MRNRPLLLALIALGCATPRDAGTPALTVTERVHALADSAGVEVGVWFEDLVSGDTVVLNPDLRMHAASTMKVPVMVQLFRDADDGRLSLIEPVEVVNRFRSIADTSYYSLSPADDSDSTLYARVGGPATVPELIDLMITRSSNLATNNLIALAGAARITATMRALGADSIAVLRGVEDGPAFRAGLSNTTTARDLGRILAAVATGAAAGPESTGQMLAILRRQHFTEGIPAGLPPDAVVANKTGWIPRISHDMAYVTDPAGRRYVLVVMIRGLEDEAAAGRLKARIAAVVHQAARTG